VAGREKTSEPSTAGTSNLERRGFDYYQINVNDLPKFYGS